MFVIKNNINESFLELVFDNIKDIIKANIEDDPNNYPQTIAFNNMLNELNEKDITFDKNMISEEMLSSVVSEVLKGIHN